MEVLDELSAYNPRADAAEFVYALGCMWCKLSAGREQRNKPFNILWIGSQYTSTNNDDGTNGTIY